MWVFGVFAPEEVREERLRQDGLGPVEITTILDRDQFEGPKSGQRVRDTIHLADFFIRNDTQNQSDLNGPLDRFLEILFEIGVRTPTLDETAMYAAVSAAASSACMSRQVGASIYSDQGEQIGIGSNDVPKFGGGLYRPEMDQNDHRCFKWKGELCHNDDRKDKLYSQIFGLLKDEGLLARKATPDKVRSSLAETDIRNLIEYSRAVHAEMEAIISVGRGNKSGLLGATMYSTTFPCHHCARHIVAAGINRVVYIEPYAKSLAMDLHSDSISIKKRDEGDAVIFQQYEGVAPKNLVRLFKSESGRKGELGRAPKPDFLNASPRSTTQLDGFDSRELKIVQHVEDLEGNA